MDDPALVGGVECVGDLASDGDCFVDRNRAACDPLREILTFDQFHDERTNAAAFFEAVDVRDVWMIEGRQRLCFAVEACESIGIGRERVRQNLHRDVAIELRIARAVHLAHSSCAQGTENLIETEPGTG